MNLGDLVICTSAKDGSEKIGMVIKIMGNGWYRVLFNDGSITGTWSLRYMRKVSCTQ
jgi:hypothetical protein